MAVLYSSTVDNPVEHWLAVLNQDKTRSQIRRNHHHIEVPVIVPLL